MPLITFEYLKYFPAFCLYKPNGTFGDSWTTHDHYVGSADAVLLDSASAVGDGSVSAPVVVGRRKKPSPVVHSRTVTVKVFAVTSVMLTLSIKDLTRGGGSHTSPGRLTGDQWAGLQLFFSGDPTSVVVDSSAADLPRAFPDSFRPPTDALPRSRCFGSRRPLTMRFLILSRRTDDDEEDFWRGDRVDVQCWRAPYVGLASSTDRDAVCWIAAGPPPTMFRRGSSSSSSSLVSSDDTVSADGDTDASSVSLDSLLDSGGSGRRARAPRPAADRRLLSAGELFCRP